MVKGRTFQRREGWWARVWFTDPITGKRKDIQRRAKSRADAQDLLHSLRSRVEAFGVRALDRDRATFAAFAASYRDRYLVAPEYRDDKKVSGLRSWRSARGRLLPLLAWFGAKRLREIRFSDLEAYRADRLSGEKRGGGRRSIATVNRELALLRRMFNVGVRDGFMSRNPFATGDTLISPASETQRQRILTQEEEARLLAACEDPRRRHLRALIIAALDTGMRRGELLTLRWRNVDLEAGRIAVESINTKTLRARMVPVTPRLHRELLGLCGEAEDDALVFGVTNTAKTSFGTARTAAGLPDVRFHDLRHTAATRLVRGALPLSEVARILGHAQLSTTYRYVNADGDTLARATKILAVYEKSSAPAKLAGLAEATSPVAPHEAPISDYDTSAGGRF